MLVNSSKDGRMTLGPRVAVEGGAQRDGEDSNYAAAERDHRNAVETANQWQTVVQ